MIKGVIPGWRCNGEWKNAAVLLWVLDLTIFRRVSRWAFKGFARCLELTAGIFQVFIQWSCFTMVWVSSPLLFCVYIWLLCVDSSSTSSFIPPVWNTLIPTSKLPHGAICAMSRLLSTAQNGVSRSFVLGSHSHICTSSSFLSFNCWCRGLILACSAVPQLYVFFPSLTLNPRRLQCSLL